MIKNLWLGFNVFKKKEFLKIFIAYLFLGIYTLFITDYLFNLFSSINLQEVQLINYTSFIINGIGFGSILLTLLSIFGLMFFSVYLTVIIAQTESKKKTTIRECILKSLGFTLISFLVLLLMVIVLSILGTYINIFTIIIIILFIILGLFLLLMFYIANINLGLYNLSVKESLENARAFVRKKFWTTIGFLILIFIIYYIFYFIFDLIYFELFFYDLTAAIIVNELFLFIITLYMVNAFVLYVKSQKFL